MLDRTQAIAPDAEKTAPGLRLAVCPPVELWQIALWPGFSSATAQALGLPETVGAVVETGERVAMALAPGRWLIEDLPCSAAPEVAPDTGAVTALGHSRSCFSVSGGHAADLMQNLMPIDLSLPQHGVGRVIQTGSGHSIAFTARRRAEDDFVLYVERSYGRDFWESLQAEAASFGITADDH